MLLNALVLLLTASLATSQLKTICPSKESLSNCKCAIDIDKMPWISCSGLSSLEQFQKNTKFMVGYHFNNFFIDKSNLGRLPSNIFNGMDIQSLKISFTNLTYLGDGINRPPFVGLENSVEDIEIIDCFISDTNPLTTIGLSHLKKLTQLQLTNNVVPVIGNDWFQTGPYDLKELYFTTSSTRQLGSHAFAFLSNLKILSVTGGSISQISRSMFPTPAHHLASIDLSYNSLTTLPTDIFGAMPSLSEVYFDNNGFITIDEVPWSRVWNQLTHVYFFGNPMNCNTAIKWVYKYRLPEVLGGTCVAPAKLATKTLGHLTLKDFE